MKTTEKGPRCGARTTTYGDGRPCQNLAGKGTAHPGEGRCKFHGGLSKRKPDARLRSNGLWGKCLTTAQREEYEEIKANGGLEEAVLDGALALVVKLAGVVRDVEMPDERKMELLGDHLPRIAATIERARRSKDAGPTAREELFRAQAQEIIQRMVDTYRMRHGADATAEWLAEVFPTQTPAMLVS